MATRPKSFGINQLTGPFMILTFGLLVATAAFLVELLKSSKLAK
jgi:hypothetical protein